MAPVNTTVQLFWLFCSWSVLIRKNKAIIIIIIIIIRLLFRPRQRLLNYEIKLKIIDNNTNISSGLECKEYVKCLGVLIDNHLSWKYHKDYITVKISKIVGVISRLRHLVPFCSLRCIYQSLILPYLTYGLTVWGQASKANLNNFKNNALRLIYFRIPRTHTIPFFLFLLKYYPFTYFTLKLCYTLCMMSQITLLLKISLKDLSRPAWFIHITRGLHLVANIIFNFHV